MYKALYFIISNDFNVLGNPKMKGKKEEKGKDILNGKQKNFFLAFWEEIANLTDIQLVPRKGFGSACTER